MTKALKKITKPLIILANRLDDGRAVFFAEGQQWSPHVAKSLLARNAEELESLLAKANVSEASNDVVSITPIEANIDEHGVPSPAHIKFHIQAQGPTVRLDLGYQAEG